MERVKEYRLLRQWSREWAVAVCRFFSFVGQEMEPRASDMPGVCSAIELHHHLGYEVAQAGLELAIPRLHLWCNGLHHQYWLLNQDRVLKICQKWVQNKWKRNLCRGAQELPSWLLSGELLCTREETGKKGGFRVGRSIEQEYEHI